MRCMYIYMYDDIFWYICDIYLCIHDTHAISWISTNPTDWISPQKNPEVNQSRSYLCSTIRAGAQWKSHRNQPSRRWTSLDLGDPFCFGWWRKIRRTMLVVYPTILPGFEKHPTGGWPWDFWTISSIINCWVNMLEFLFNVFLDYLTSGSTFMVP